MAAGLVDEGVALHSRRRPRRTRRRRLYQRQGEAELARARYERDPRRCPRGARRAADRFRRGDAPAGRRAPRRRSWRPRWSSAAPGRSPTAGDRIAGELTGTGCAGTPRASGCRSPGRCSSAASGEAPRPAGCGRSG